MVWYGMVWYGMVWYGMVWYGTVWRKLIFLKVVGPDFLQQKNFPYPPNFAFAAKKGGYLGPFKLKMRVIASKMKSLALSLLILSLRPKVVESDLLRKKHLPYPPNFAFAAMKGGYLGPFELKMSVLARKMKSLRISLLIEPKYLRSDTLQ